MNHEEFKEVVIALYSAFPGVNEWVRKNSPDQAATHGSWFRTLQQFTKAECMAVVDSWERGDRNPPSYVDMAHMALTIRACVLFDRGKSNASKTQQDAPRRRRNESLAKDSQFDIAPLLGAFLAKLDDGRNVEQAQAEIEALIAKMPVREDMRPRYRCFACRDSGVRIVWHPDDIDLIRRGDLVRGDVVHEASVACHTCERGSAMACSTGWQRGKIATYDESRYCLKENDPFEFGSRRLGKEWVA